MSTRTEATEGQAKIKEALTAMRKHFGENDRTPYEHRMFSLADEALSILDASPPIVGEPVSSPAPSVIEAGAIQRFAHDFCGKFAQTFSSHDSVAIVIELREALEKFLRDQAKASRPSVTAAQGVTVEDISFEVRQWADHWKLKLSEPKDETSKAASIADLYARLSALLTNPK